MAGSQPFLAALPRQGGQCLLCNEVGTTNEKRQIIGMSGLNSVNEKASLWAAIKIPENDKPYHEFTFVKDRMNLLTRTLEAHATCRVKFRTHLVRKQNEYGQPEDMASVSMEESSTEDIEEETTNYLRRRNAG